MLAIELMDLTLIPGDVFRVMLLDGDFVLGISEHLGVGPGKFIRIALARWTSDVLPDTPAAATRPLEVEEHERVGIDRWVVDQPTVLLCRASSPHPDIVTRMCDRFDPRRAVCGSLSGVAHVYPDRVKAGTPAGERKLHSALQRLSDDWTVIHSVAWQGDRNGRPADGEADFVVLHPAHGLLVIEVKGGGIHVERGRWYSSNSEGRYEIKDPFRQATDSKHFLARYLQLPKSATGHAVAFPDIHRPTRLGPHAPPDMTIDRGDLSDIAGAVDRVVRHWHLEHRLSEQQVDTITALLCPTTDVRQLLKDQIVEIGARLLRLTQEQFQVLDLLRRQRRTLILGGAGTGKTLLAVERARRLAIEGFSVLLTCFNRPLAQHLAAEFVALRTVKVHSFHQLVTWQLKTAGIEIPPDPPQEWWDRTSASALVEAAEQNGLRFDAVVVDEGQDFPSEWFTALQMLLADPDVGPFYVFADALQAIYRPDWQPPFDGEPYLLVVNCRNTIPIAAAVRGVFEIEAADLGVDGPLPAWVIADSPEAAAKAVGAQLHRLVHEGGLNPSQVVVLTQTRATAELIRSKPRAGLSLVASGANGLGCETIHRFKGLEADAAIVVLERMEEERDRQLAYIGLSRPRAELVVIGPQEVLDSLR